MRRRFRFSNYQSASKVRPFTCSAPLALKPGWNQMQLNLAHFTTRAYGTNYLETQRIQVHANCRIRRVYFSDRLYTEEELPREYRVHSDRRSSKYRAPPVEKVTSILKQLTTEDEKSQSEPKPPTPDRQEAVVKQTSFGNLEMKSTTGTSLPDKSSSGVSLVKHLPSMESLRSRKSGLGSDNAIHYSLSYKESQQSKSNYTATTIDEDKRQVGEELNAASKGTQSATSVAREQALLEMPAESPEERVTEDEISPRTESEFTESEPITESDAELDSPAELADYKDQD